MLNDLGAEIEAHGGCAVPIPADLTDLDRFLSRLEELLEECGISREEITLVVNNAGSASFGPVVREDPRSMSTAIRLNIEAPARIIRWAVSAMSRGGVICNVASVAAFTPGPLMASYYAAKAWMLSFGESLAEEVKDDGIAVVTCCPGPFESGFHATAGIDPRRVGSAASARSVAEGVVRAISRRRVVAPIGMAARVWAVIGPRLPRSWSRKIIGRLQQRRSS